MSFQLKLDPKRIKKMIDDTYPEIFPEIRDRMNLPVGTISGIMRKHIYRLYKNRGIEGVLEFRDQCEKERDQAIRRMNRELPNDDQFHLKNCIDYFDMWVDNINHLKNELIDKGHIDEGCHVSLVDPKDAAIWFRAKSKHNEYSFDEIESAMTITRDYIRANGLKYRTGHVNKIAKKINSDATQNTRRNWVEKYCDYSGLREKS